MSHMVKGKTNFTVDNKDILIEALKEAYEGCQVLENAQMSTYGRQQCDIVVKRKNGRDIGFRKQADGTYEGQCYEPGYGGDAVAKALKPVYEPYGRGVARDMIKRNPNLRNYRMGKTKEVERNGKKMKRIRLQQAGGGY